MDTLPLFLTYAAEFEKTLADDEWSRLEPFFCDDAVYTVESDHFGCRLEGPAAIFAGMKKSLDGFDRHFGSRDLELQGEPKVEGDTLSVGWKVIYHRDGSPDFVLRGASSATLRDGRIAELTDTYDEAVHGEMEAWVRETGIQLDPAYV